MKKHKLLIIDNNYPILESLHSLISYYPEFVLFTLDKLDTVLKDITENTYDIIFLDYSLLSINCVDLCNYIRASNLNKYSYIVVLSNENHQDKQVSIFQSAQFDDFIYKASFTNQMFITKVKAITRREEKLYNEQYL